MFTIIFSIILDNINLADVANQFIERKDSRTKIQTFSQNYLSYIYKIKLTPDTFYKNLFPIKCIKRGAVERFTIH